MHLMATREAFLSSRWTVKRAALIPVRLSLVGVSNVVVSSAFGFTPFSLTEERHE